MNKADPTMDRVRAVFEASGLTLDELGKRMGHEGDVARKGAWQFLNKIIDPRLSTLRKFAEAVGVSLADLVNNDKRKSRK
jgi:transcriptional regulator with XRE-family HTH domain